jgi:nucleotide-binding universal stress UspA family protein
MNSPDQKLSIRRILVALDASTHSLTALETAAELASRLRAELIGLFVEDINLVRMTELPFAREVSLFSPLFRQIELPVLERQFRMQANLMRQALAAIAGQRQVSWQFRVARGAVPAEVLLAEAEADLTIVGRAGRSLSGSRRIGSTTRMILAQGRRITLILQQGSRLVVPIMVIYDGSALSQKALDMAENLVAIRDGHLSVFILAGSSDAARRLEAQVFDQLRAHGLGADFRLIIQPNLSWLAHLVQMEGSGPVILPCGGELFDGEGLCALVNEISNPILLVR